MKREVDIDDPSLCAASAAGGEAGRAGRARCQAKCETRAHYTPGHCASSRQFCSTVATTSVFMELEASRVLRSTPRLSSR